jgi:alpha-glucosidase
VVARRKGDKWFVAGINGKNEAKEIQINLPVALNKPTFIGDGEHSSDWLIFNIPNTINSFSISMTPNGGFVLY